MLAGRQLLQCEEGQEAEKSRKGSRKNLINLKQIEHQEKPLQENVKERRVVIQREVKMKLSMWHYEVFCKSWISLIYCSKMCCFSLPRRKYVMLLNHNVEEEVPRQPSNIVI